MMPAEIFKQLIGQWEGTCRTWFEPGKLADESNVAGEFTALLDGRFLRHVYSGSMQAKPRYGEDLLAYNNVRKVFQSAWFDDFHMNYALLISEGPATEKVSPSWDTTTSLTIRPGAGAPSSPWSAVTSWSSRLTTLCQVNPSN